MLNDPSKPAQIYKSTRSQVQKLIQSQGGVTNNSMTAVMKGSGTNSMPYQIQLKSSSYVKNGAKTSSKTKQ